jgi:hypothetical protein
MAPYDKLTSKLKKDIEGKSALELLEFIVELTEIATGIKATDEDLKDIKKEHYKDTIAHQVALINEKMNHVRSEFTGGKTKEIRKKYKNLDPIKREEIYNLTEIASQAVQYASAQLVPKRKNLDSKSKKKSHNIVNTAINTHVVGNKYYGIFGYLTGMYRNVGNKQFNMNEFTKDAQKVQEEETSQKDPRGKHVWGVLKSLLGDGPNSTKPKKNLKQREEREAGKQNPDNDKKVSGGSRDSRNKKFRKPDPSITDFGAFPSNPGQDKNNVTLK